MSLGRVLVVAIALLLLQGCASVRMSEQFEQGKRSFVDGEYKQALHELLPTAVYGNAKAQYAVGFIYYNGYGVPQDTESGIFWMTMSANQGYVPAKKALTAIQRENLIKAANKKQMTVSVETATPAVRTKPVSPFKDEAVLTPKAHLIKTTSAKSVQKDEVLQALMSAQLLPPIKKKTPARTVVKNEQINLPVPPPYNGKKANYTLQLFGSYHQEEVRTLQTKLSSAKVTRCWHTKREGRDWFVLTYGEFKTSRAAKSALISLPGAIREMNPWIRPMTQLELA
jgi:TPR repeat protein